MGVISLLIHLSSMNTHEKSGNLLTASVSGAVTSVVAVGAPLTVSVTNGSVHVCRIASGMTPQVQLAATRKGTCSQQETIPPKLSSFTVLDVKQRVIDIRTLPFGSRCTRR